MSRTKTHAVSVEALSRIDSRDMLILQDTASRVLADITRFHETDHAKDAAVLEAATRESIESAYGFAPEDEDERKPFVYSDGVAVIPIHGTLLNRFNGAWGFVTGYQYVRRMLNLALADDDVDLIVFDVDSPGGEAAGCFELAREIMASREVKPSLAVVDSVAASGGMALAAPATAVYAIPSARVGSIGVYRMHVSYEDNLKQAGIKVTFATAGAHKVDGNPYQDLPQSVLDDWRESAGKTWDDFVALIAEARDLSEEDVRATEARIYRADEALAKGLITAVKTPTEAVAAFLAELAEGEPFTEDEEEVNMADSKTTTKGGAEVTSSLSEADIQRIAAAVVPLAAKAGADAATAVSAAIERKQAIRDHAQSIGPQAAALAKTLIDNDAISADDAIGMLDAAFGSAQKADKGKVKVKSQARGSRVSDDEDEDDGDEDDGDEDEDEDDGGDGGDEVNHFDRVMSNVRHPNAGGGRSKKGGEQGGAPVSNPLLADHAKVTGSSWSADALKKAG